MLPKRTGTDGDGCSRGGAQPPTEMAQAFTEETGFRSRSSY